MKNKSSTHSAFVSLRALLGLALCIIGAMLAFFAFGGSTGVAGLASGKRTNRSEANASKPVDRLRVEDASRFPGTSIFRTRAQQGADAADLSDGKATGPASISAPMEGRGAKSGRSFDGDLRSLPFVQEPQKERPEREAPFVSPRPYPGSESTAQNAQNSTNLLSTLAPSLNAPAPAPLATFDGLDYPTWGNGHPPDTNGDVGPNHYIQTINTSIGIYNKTTGAPIARFTFNTFMSQGNFGNLCDTDNFGDPVVLYDTFEDRWVITDFAFKLDASGNVINPPGAFQCFAVSKTSDPVSGGWNFYSINTTGGLGDYPKFGIWPDGIYMSANMFDYAAGGSFQNSRVYAFNKAQMYAGAPTVQSVSFNLPSDQFTVLPANARLQTGTPPAGSPNYMACVWNFLNSMQVFKFKVDWNFPATSAVTGPFDSTMAFWWAQFTATNALAPTPKNSNDTLYPRLMMENQYSNIGGVESLWNSHTVGGGTNPNPITNVSAATQSGVRYYQTNVTGGTVGANTVQSYTYPPDTTLYRYMPSVAVDRLGDLAIGYTTSNSTNNPALRYAGRFAGDPVNSITQTEQTLFQGTGAQTGNCGTSTCTRWGDYSAMSLDPNGCDFWYTNMYYADNTLNHRTRVGTFKLNASCTNVGTGTISGAVTTSPGAAPLPGATVSLGSRTATTDSNGNYSFTGLPEGTYPTMSATSPGRTTSTVATIVVTNGGTTIRNFSLTAAAQSNCATDTSLTDFQAGVPNNVDITTSPGDAILTNSPAIDQQNTTLSTNGFGFSNTSWWAQTFTAGVTGQATRVDVNLFCASCTGNPPNVTVSIRNASGNLPTGADLASASVPFSTSGAGGNFSATFASPPTLTAGIQYAIVVRMSAAYSTGTPAYTVSFSAPNSTALQNPYPGGRRATSTNSGGAWTGASGNAQNDTGFKVYMRTGFSSPGDYTSGVKDTNPATGATPTWGTFSWTNLALPAGTGIKFQAAAANNSAGPFSFVGPDGSTATFYTTPGGSLAQFNGKRYLKYKSYLTTTNGANTPTLNDVTVCFTDLASSALAADNASGTFGGTATLSATLTSSGNPVSGKNISFTLNGTSKGSATTNASGVATVPNASLAGIGVGNYPTGVGASFAGDGSFTSSTATGSLTVSQASQTITVSTSAPASAAYQSQFIVAATASSGLPVTYSSSGACTNTGATFTMTSGTGTCTVRYDQAGNANYNAAPPITETVTAQKVNATWSTNSNSKTYGTADPNPLTSGSGTGFIATDNVTATYSRAPGETVAGGPYHITATLSPNGVLGNYNITNDGADFTINRKDATWTTNNNSKTYNDADPNPITTGSGSGFVASDGVTASYSRDPGETVGGSPYHITTALSPAGVLANYNLTNNGASFSITKAASTTTVTVSNATYDGASHGGTAVAEGAGGLSQGLDVNYTGRNGTSYGPSTTAPTNGGDYTASATFAGDDNHTGSSDSKNYSIAKTDANITVTPYGVTYNGSSHMATGSAVGVEMPTPVDLTSLLHLNGTTHTNAGTYTDTWNFDGNVNYKAATATITDQIDKATATIVVTEYSVTYNALPYTATGSAKGVNNEDLTGLVLTGTTHTDAGDYPADGWTFTNANYNDQAGSVHDQIGKAPSTTMVSVANSLFDGLPHGGTASVTGVGNLNQGLTVYYSGRNGTSYPTSTSAPSGAGDYTASASYPGDSNHDGSADAKDYNIGKASPVIYWNNPATIVYGTPLGAAQLNAVAKVGSLVIPGSYLYAPAAGTLLNAGNGQTLAVTFTPDDPADYNGATKSVLINVNQKPATVTADNKSKQFSDPLPSFTATVTGLVGTDTLGGSMTFSTTATALSPAGTYSIVPGGTGFNPNYSVSFVNGTLTVTQEDATLTYTGDTLLTAGSNNTATVVLAAAVQEAQDGYLGNALGGKMVKFSIYKSSNITLTTADYTATATINGVTNIASTTISLPDDDYSIKLEMVSNLYYSAPVEAAAVTVVVPGSGQASGGGWLTDPNASRGHFAFTVKYVPSGKPKGHILYIYRDQLDLSAYGAPSGLRDYDLIVKSTALTALNLNTTTLPATAAFTGKNIIVATDRITGTSYTISGGLSLQFEVDVTDNGEPGSSDTYALRIWNTTGTYRAVGTYTPSGVNTSQVTLGGGNIQVK